MGAYLQKRLFDHGLIRPEFIAYDMVGHYILCDHMMEGNYQQINYKDFCTSRKLYMSPEVFARMCQRDSQKNQERGLNYQSELIDVNKYKSDVFSFGLV